MWTVLSAMKSLIYSRTIRVTCKQSFVFGRQTHTVNSLLKIKLNFIRVTFQFRIKWIVFRIWILSWLVSSCYPIVMKTETQLFHNVSSNRNISKYCFPTHWYLCVIHENQPWCIDVQYWHKTILILKYWRRPCTPVGSNLHCNMLMLLLKYCYWNLA